MNHGHYNDLEQPEPLRAAFLIRCWREGEQWRFVLENVTTRERCGFDNIEALCIFMQSLIQDTAG